VSVEREIINQLTSAFTRYKSFGLENPKVSEQAKAYTLKTGSLAAKSGEVTPKYGVVLRFHQSLLVATGGRLRSKATCSLTSRKDLKMGNTFKTVLVACAAIAVAWLSADTAQLGLQSRLESNFKAYLDRVKNAEQAVLDSRAVTADGLASEVPSGKVVR
jgi:hypothetical protein